MLAELEREDPGLANIRRELVQTGIRLVPAGLGAQLANWAFESRDWRSLEALWITYSPAELMSNPRARSAYVEASAEQRSRWPGLSFATGVSSAFDPASGQLDLDLLIATLIRDGRTLHARWHDKEPVDAEVAAGTLWMLAQATIPESLEDPMLDGAMETYLELTRVIRESSISGNAVSGRSLTFFHATASLMAFMRADWARARREAELGMILTDSCGFAGFLAARGRRQLEQRLREHPVRDDVREVPRAARRPQLPGDRLDRTCHAPVLGRRGHSSARPRADAPPPQAARTRGRGHAVVQHPADERP